MTSVQGRCDILTLPLPLPAIEWPNAPDDPDDLARYRWWIGHQLTFCVWRLLSERLTSIARDLGMQRSNVSRAIRQLVEHGAIVALEGEGRVRKYTLSDTLCWKGTLKRLRNQRNGGS